MGLRSLHAGTPPPPPCAANLIEVVTTLTSRIETKDVENNKVLFTSSGCLDDIGPIPNLDELEIKYGVSGGESVTATVKAGGDATILNFEFGVSQTWTQQVSLVLTTILKAGKYCYQNCGKEWCSLDPAPTNNSMSTTYDSILYWSFQKTTEYKSRYQYFYDPSNGNIVSCRVGACSGYWPCVNWQTPRLTATAWKESGYWSFDKATQTIRSSSHCGNNHVHNGIRTSIIINMIILILLIHLTQAS